MNCEDDLWTSRRVTSSTRKSPPRSQRTCWNLETGELVTSCTIIVTDANALTRQIHDRLPVMLDKANVRPWLSGEAGTELLKPAAEDRLRVWPVSRRAGLV